MKKLFFCSLYSLLALNAYSQLSKGRQMIGGSFNYNFNSSSSKDTTGNQPQRNSKYSSFTGSVRYGYFITDNIVVGLTASYNQGSSNGESSFLNQGQASLSSFNQVRNSYYAGVFSRYYKMLGQSKFAVFGNLTLGYGMGTSKDNFVYTPANGYNNGETIQKISNIGAGFSPGLTYFLTNKIALESYFGNFGFTVQKAETSRNGKIVNEATNSNFNSNLNLSFSNLFIGVNFYFGGNVMNKQPKEN